MVRGLETRLSLLEQAMVDGNSGESQILVGARRFQRALETVYGEAGDTPVTIETAADAARFNRDWDAALETAYGEQEA